MPHDNLHTAWHFIYYGYSKTEKRAFVYMSLRTGTKNLNYPNTNHYWTEKFYFVLGRDVRYPFWNG
jgi:hypothetical protein